MKNSCIRFLSSLLVGAALFGGSTALAAEATGEKSVQLDACTINGSVYVRLEDAAQAAGFSYTYDAADNTVTINPETASSAADAGKAGLTRNADGSINVPQDGSQYVPKAGDVIRCDDGTNYTITDVKRWDGNMFASGPVGPLPTAACDWSQFDQPELPKGEARHFTVEKEEYLFIRNLYETRRMLYTLYNAMGSHTATWKDGQAVRRSDGTPWVHIQLSLPKGESVFGFWPWSAEEVTGSLAAAPCGDRYMEAWDVYKDGVFQRTEYKMK